MSVVAVTGANGFVGKNVAIRLAEVGHTMLPLRHDMDAPALAEKMAGADFVIHLAGVSRPQTEAEFETGNVGLTQRVVDAIQAQPRALPLFYASSTQAELDNAYGRSKRAAEDIVLAYGESSGMPVHVWRLPHVFGKWARPNYNSVVATFCHNIARDLPITINDPSVCIRLAYIDDIVAGLLAMIADGGQKPIALGPVYEMRLGELAAQLHDFHQSRQTLTPGAVGTGLLRALYATYLSYLEPANFAYRLVAHADARGLFAEVLRTPDAGQFSFFTAMPGVTRGGHYHHSKTEKFLVVQGKARFGFRNIITHETYEMETSDQVPQVVETIPGWAHDIVNIGEDIMVVMLWANEVFDRDRPDTVAAKVLNK